MRHIQECVGTVLGRCSQESSSPLLVNECITNKTKNSVATSQFPLISTAFDINNLLHVLFEMTVLQQFIYLILLFLLIVLFLFPLLVFIPT